MLEVADIEPAFGHWFAGFADGEGSFNVSRHAGGRQWRCGFAIALRRDDEPVLEDVLAVLGGKLYQTHNRRVGADKPQSMWAANTKADCRRMVEFFDRFPLRSKKARDFAIWRQAVALWETVPGRWEQQRAGVAFDWSQFERLAEELREGRRYALAVAA